MPQSKREKAIAIEMKKAKSNRLRVDDFIIDQRGFLRFKESGFTPTRDIHEKFAQKVKAKQFGSAK